GTNLGGAGAWAARRSHESAKAGERAAVRCGTAVPSDDGRSREKFCAGLREADDVPVAGWIWHSPRWRDGVCGSFAGSLLRFTAGEGDRVGREFAGSVPADGPGAAGVPHPWREDEYPVR